jgi:hypothetical protein
MAIWNGDASTRNAAKKLSPLRLEVGDEINCAGILAEQGKRGRRFDAASSP